MRTTLEVVDGYLALVFFVGHRTRHSVRNLIFRLQPQQPCQISRGPGVFVEIGRFGRRFECGRKTGGLFQDRIETPQAILPATNSSQGKTTEGA